MISNAIVVAIWLNAVSAFLKECRSLATRFEKLAVHFLGMVHLAIIERYLRLLTRQPSTT